jgi:hypothetical protein
MAGYDASSTERYSGPVELRVGLAQGLDAQAIDWIETNVRAVLRAIEVGYFFPGTCRGPATDCRRDECVFDREVEFDDGRRMAIQVIASSEPAEGCWTQGRSGPVRRDLPNCVSQRPSLYLRGNAPSCAASRPSRLWEAPFFSIRRLRR